MQAVLVSTILCIPCKESLPGIWSTQFCVSFLIIPNTPITSRKNFVWIFYILITSISKSLYESFWNSFNEMLWSEGTDTSIMMQFRSSWFSIIKSGLFASIFRFAWTVKSHKMVTFFPSTSDSGACWYHFSVCDIS